ncbi:MAG: acetylglucosamine transferase [Betaproteobacteria bacterium]|nr:acetylglucosamine transferase [Betaproteobacteria bacterium]NDD11504.1 acetylglucosamine transferase [Betaproteobacteria bacterium]
MARSRHRALPQANPKQGKRPASAQIDPRLHRALTLQGQGNIDEAESLFMSVLKDQPRNGAVLYSLGAIAHQRGQFAQALEWMSQCIAVMPQFAQAHQAKATIELAIKRNSPGDAASGQSEASPPLPDTPGHAKRDPRLGVALQLHETGRSVEAKALFEAILVDYPQDFASHYSMCAIQVQMGRPELGLLHIDRAIAVAPSHVPARFAKGTVQLAMGQPEAAIIAFDEALKLDPNNIESLLNKATAYHHLRLLGEGVKCLQQVLRIDPKHEKALGNLGYMLTELNMNNEAAKVFDRLIKVNPNYDYVHGLKLKAQMHCCDWSEYSSGITNILAGLEAGKRYCNSLAIMALTDDAAVHLQAATLWAHHRCPPSSTPLWQGERYQHHKIRVAYMSPDFREHPVGHSFCGVLEQHDPRRFELIGISLGVDDNSKLRRRFKQAFDHFVDARFLSSQELARWIRMMEVDILVDLAGYTAGSRTEVLAMRPAPVQVNYLGYPGTMAAPYIDYLLADETVIPAENARYFTEQVMYLPGTYLPADYSIEAAEQSGSREDHGLPADGFVFCSFNHDYKLNPPMFALWMRLLESAEGSVLWLMKLNEEAEANIVKETERAGIDPKRVIFAKRVPKVEDHLARYRHVGLFLDTFPYNAHSTARDALRCGCPVLTMKGGSFPSRVAAGMVKTFGLDALVVEDYASYEALALALAQEPEKLEAVRSKLQAGIAQEREQGSEKRFAFALMHRLTEMYQRHLQRVGT